MASDLLFAPEVTWLVQPLLSWRDLFTGPIVILNENQLRVCFPIKSFIEGPLTMENWKSLENK